MTASPDDDLPRSPRPPGVPVHAAAPDPGVDRLVRVAAALLRAPTALVVLGDSECHWLKACHGLSPSGVAPADALFGDPAVGRELLHVPDASRDARFREHAWVVGEPRVRCYCRVPLDAGDGTVLGALCVMDGRRRDDIDGEQLERLRDLATAIAEHIRHHGGLGQVRREEAELGALRELLTAVYEHVPVGVALADGQGRIVQANRRLAALLETDTATLAGSPIGAWLSTDADTGSTGDARAEAAGLVHSAEPIAVAGRPGHALHTVAERSSPARELARHRGRARILERVARQLDPGETLQRLVALAADAGSTGAAFLYLPRERAQRPMVIAPALEALGDPAYLEHTLGAMHAAAGEHRGPVALDAVLDEPGPLAGPLGAHAVVMQRLRAGSDGRVGSLGVLLASAERSEAVQAELGELAGLAEVALNDSDMLGRLYWGAYHDELTGLANARLLERRFPEMRDRVRRGGQRLAVLAVDLTGIGAINERFGRDAGDDVLRHVATMLSGSLRGHDLVARTDSDEFVILAALGGADDARAVAAKVVDLIASVPAPDGMAVAGAVGIILDEAGLGLADLLAEANAATQAARRAGGHQWQPARRGLR